MIPNAYLIQRLTRLSRTRALTKRESVILQRAIEREEKQEVAV